MLTGIDISWCQGAMRWNALPTDVRFVISKASEGLGRDPNFTKNTIGACEAGRFTGSYHVLRPSVDPTQQAQHYFDVAGSCTDMPPALDFEVLRGARPHDALAAAEAFVLAIEALWLKPCLVYTYPHFWRELLGNPLSPTLGARPLWIANYGVTKPYIPKAWLAWTIWQYDGDGGKKLPWGTDVDFNVFAGDEADMQAFCSATVTEGESA